MNRPRVFYFLLPILHKRPVLFSLQQEEEEEEEEEDKDKDKDKDKEEEKTRAQTRRTERTENAFFLVLIVRVRGILRALIGGENKSLV